MKDWRERITIDPGKRGGKPCIRDLRITVDDVLQMIASGMDEDEILTEFPTLTAEDLKAVRLYENERKNKTVVHPGA